MKLLIILVGILGSFMAYAEDQRVAFPTDYKSNFVEYLSLDRTMNPDQFIRLFANQTAMAARDAKGNLPEGSVLVAEVYSVRKDAAGNVISSALNRRIPDQLKLVAVMEKRAAYGTSPASPILTGDWDFGAYKPNGESASKDLNACRACHLPLTKSDFVFSTEHLK